MRSLIQAVITGIPAAEAHSFARADRGRKRVRPGESNWAKVRPRVPHGSGRKRGPGPLATPEASQAPNRALVPHPLHSLRQRGTSQFVEMSALRTREVLHAQDGVIDRKVTHRRQSRQRVWTRLSQYWAPKMGVWSSSIDAHSETASAGTRTGMERARGCESSGRAPIWPVQRTVRVREGVTWPVFSCFLVPGP